MGSISLDTLVLAKKYTDKVLTGLGALKGSPCTLKATKENDDGSITVTFSWTSSDGVEETQDVIIPAGPQGEKGIQGEKGTDGVSPTVTITESTGRHTISFSDKDGVKSITIKDGSPEDMANYYTKDETDKKLNLKANTSDIPIIPTNLSELNNDENYIKNTAENLTNYYKKTETYSQTEVNTLLANINKLTSKIVTELPSENISESTIYLIEVESQKNVYMQYMYINGSFAALGTTAIDLSNVYTKGEVDKKLEEKADKTEIPTIPTLISSFTNDKGYMTEFTETDPTVPAWAKTENKPSYTAAEVGALPEDTEIPIFINKTVLDGITAEKVENWDEAVETKTNLEAHTNNMISSKTGVHGMRYFNDTFQVQNEAGEWVDIETGGGGGGGNDDLKIVTFANGTDEEILAMIDAHYANKINIRDYWAVGDKRTVHLSAMSATGVGESHREQDVQFAIADFDHDELTTTINGHTKAAVTLTQVDCLMDSNNASNPVNGSNNTENGYMNSTDTNIGGWKDCARRTWCNNVYFNALPSTIKNAVKSVNKKTSAGNKNSTINITSDKVFLLSEIEIYGTDLHGATGGSFLGEGTPYIYYETTSSRVKQPLWDKTSDSCAVWQRSPNRSSVIYFCSMSLKGLTSGGYYNASAAFGIAPCLCL